MPSRSASLSLRFTPRQPRLRRPNGASSLRNTRPAAQSEIKRCCISPIATPIRNSGAVRSVAYRCRFYDGRLCRDGGDVTRPGFDDLVRKQPAARERSAHGTARIARENHRVAVWVGQSFLSRPQLSDRAQVGGPGHPVVVRGLPADPRFLSARERRRAIITPSARTESQTKVPRQRNRGRRRVRGCGRKRQRHRRSERFGSQRPVRSQRASRLVTNDCRGHQGERRLLHQAKDRALAPAPARFPPPKRAALRRGPPAPDRLVLPVALRISQGRYRAHRIARLQPVVPTAIPRLETTLGAGQGARPRRARASLGEGPPGCERVIRLLRGDDDSAGQHLQRERWRRWFALANKNLIAA